MKALAPSPPIAFTAAGAPTRSGGGTQSQRATAELHLHEPDVDKSGNVTVGPPLGTIPFQFNPKEVTVAKSAKWTRKAAKKSKTAGSAEFSGAEPCKLTMEMFFDASHKGDPSVVESVEALFSCCVPTEKSKDKPHPVPPLVKLQWGTITSFPAYVTQISAKFTLFASDGTPIRAACSVSLEEVRREPQKTNPTSGGLTVQRVHSLVEGDSLASVAYAEYGDPELWRRLAEYNGVDDPMDLTRGQVLLLPAIGDLLPAMV